MPSKKPSSTVTKKSADHEIQHLITSYAPAFQKLIIATRKQLRKRLPTAIEIVYEYRSWFVISFSPSVNGYEGVLGIRASADSVKLFLNRGKELQDPSKLLKGSGGMVRSIELDSVAMLKQPEVVNLIEQAIALNPLPFPATGKGSVIFR